MIYRQPRIDEGEAYEKMASHPLQSAAWGDFREETGVETQRLIGFEGSNPVAQMQITFHEVPKIGYSIGYFPKGLLPDEVSLAALKELGQREKAVFIKLEPDVSSPPYSMEKVKEVRQFLLDHGCERGRALFTPHSFILDLNKSDEELMAQMKSKTRYNVRLAERKGVKVAEDNSDQGFADYMELLRLTTKRQQFYAHTERYHTLMWKHMRKAGIARLLKATYEGKTLVAWILFVYKDKLYYPYGASSRENREVMASNLVMWEAIQLGKREGCNSFDLWGALGPDPDKNDPWYGFHNFKEGYGGALAEFVGSYDLVINPPLYKLYRWADQWRWRWLRLKSKLPFLG